MTLAPLVSVASAQELLGRDLTDAENRHLEKLLAVASDTVRDAAGQLLSRTTTTVRLIGSSSRRLRLPQIPVVSVDQIVIDGTITAPTSWRLLGGELDRAGGWSGCDDVEVEVTYTHGWDPVPGPVQALVIQLAAAAVARLEEDGLFGSMPGIVQESISPNSHAVTWGSDEPAPSSVFELPERTRRWLRRDYGLGEVFTVGSR